MTDEVRTALDNLRDLAERLQPLSRAQALIDIATVHRALLTAERDLILAERRAQDPTP